MTEKIFQIGIKALIRDKKGRILVLKKSSPFKATGAYWDMPGGRVENEGIEGTLKRELGEEIGVKNAKIFGLSYALLLPKIKINTAKGPVALCLLVYNCKIPANAKIKLSSEHTEYRWISMTESRKLLKVYKFPEEFINGL